ncbi:MAG: 4-vinyl reductase [Acidobacteria bacterium]|nr:4-vinyl reductase [Acidobacteriota bacterium]
MEYQAKNPNAKVIGGSILAFLASLTNRELGLKYLEKHGITDVKADGWYSHQALLSAEKDLVDAIGVPTALEGVGEKIPDNAKMPEWKDIYEVFENWTNVYMNNHQGDNESYFKVIDKTEHSIKIETNNAYSCAFDRGLFRAVARKFFPTAKVTETGNKCRAKGDNICVYHIVW